MDIKTDTTYSILGSRIEMEAILNAILCLLRVEKDNPIYTETIAILSELEDELDYIVCR